MADDLVKVSGLSKDVAWVAIMMAFMQGTSQGVAVISSGIEIAQLLPLILKGFSEAAAYKTSLVEGFRLASATTSVV